MKTSVYKKRMDWNSITVQACFILFMLLLMLPGGIGEKKDYPMLFLIACFLMVIILSFAGCIYYRLIIEDDRILEKRIFHRTRTVLCKDVKTVVVSLRGIIRVKTEDEQIYICCMKEMDALWLDLKERVGEKKIEFATGKPC